MAAFALIHEIEQFTEAGVDYANCEAVQNEAPYGIVKSMLRRISAKVVMMSEENSTGGMNLETLRALALGLAPEQFLKIIEQFSADLDKYRKQAIAHAESGNAVSLARVCHAMKGLAASFGGQHLARLSSQIEDLARDGDTAIAFSMTLDRMDSAVNEALKACNDIRENPLPLNHEP